jgi:hypothetical protein
MVQAEERNSFFGEDTPSEDGFTGTCCTTEEIKHLYQPIHE